MNVENPAFKKYSISIVVKNINFLSFNRLSVT